MTLTEQEVRELEAWSNRYEADLTDIWRMAGYAIQADTRLFDERNKLTAARDELLIALRELIQEIDTYQEEVPPLAHMAEACRLIQFYCPHAKVYPSTGRCKDCGKQVTP